MIIAAILGAKKVEPQEKTTTIEIRFFRCTIEPNGAELLLKRNGISLTKEQIEKNNGFVFANDVSRPCVVDTEFFTQILSTSKRKFINPNYVKESDVEISEDGKIDLRKDLPPERVLQLFWLQCIADSERECRCQLCRSIEASNAAL